LSFPGLENDKSVRLSAFVDAGYAGDKFSLDQLRYSTGLGLFWASPVGPLKISVGVPLHKLADDRTQLFQFTLGGVF